MYAHHIIHWTSGPSNPPWTPTPTVQVPDVSGGEWCSLKDLDLKDCAHLFSSAQHRSRPATVSRGEVHPFSIAQTSNNPSSTPHLHRWSEGETERWWQHRPRVMPGRLDWRFTCMLVSRWVEQHFTSGWFSGIDMFENIIITVHVSSNRHDNRWGPRVANIYR